MADYRLSRFACIRRHGAGLAVESALSDARVPLHGPGDAAVVGALAEPGTRAEIAARAGVGDAGTVLDRLLAAGMLDVRAGDGWADDRDGLLTWSFHDAFARAHGGRGDGRVAAGAGTGPPLARGAFARPLAAVQEARRSVRSYADRALAVRELVDFLRVAVGGQELLPGMAAPLRAYVVAARCEGLAPGLYRHAAPAGGLEHVCAPGEDVDRMLDDAARSAELAAERPHALLILTHRHERSTPYAVVLNQVGAVFQRMYVTATAMGLAPCALGSGDSLAFARAAGLDPCAEPAVGEFLLGVMR